MGCSRFRGPFGPKEMLPLMTESLRQLTGLTLFGCLVLEVDDRGGPRDGIGDKWTVMFHFQFAGWREDCTMDGSGCGSSPTASVFA